MWQHRRAAQAQSGMTNKRGRQHGQETSDFLPTVISRFLGVLGEE
jgi:hypothetical protein